MLKEILHTIKNQKGPLSLLDLSEEHQISIPLLEHMLRTLSRTGKLQEVNSSFSETCTSCKDCPTTNGCDLSEIYQEKRYKIQN